MPDARTARYESPYTVQPINPMHARDRERIIADRVHIDATGERIDEEARSVMRAAGGAIGSTIGSIRAVGSRGRWFESSEARRFFTRRSATIGSTPARMAGMRVATHATSSSPIKDHR